MRLQSRWMHNQQRCCYPDQPMFGNLSLPTEKTKQQGHWAAISLLLLRDPVLNISICVIFNAKQEMLQADPLIQEACQGHKDAMDSQSYAVLAEMKTTTTHNKFRSKRATSRGTCILMPRITPHMLARHWRHSSNSHNDKNSQELTST